MQERKEEKEKKEESIKIRVKETKREINLIYFVQKIHTRSGNFGRYIDHEIYSFSSEEEIFLNENNIDIDKVAREMAYDFYEEDKCQVVYAVHAPSNEDKHLHIHFAVNTVNYCTGKKRRENKRQTKEQEKRFQNIVDSQLPIA